MKKVIFISLGFLLIAIFLLNWQGCGKPAEQPAKEEVAKELKLPGPNGNVPTTQLLKLTPLSAQVSIALPSIAEGLDKLIRLAKRFYSEDEVNNWVQSQITQIASFAGVPEAKTLVEVAEARGFDISLPCAVYLDFSPSVESIMGILGPVSTEGENTQPGGGGKTLKDIELTDITQPNWAVMLGVKDKVKVEESLKELAIEVPEISGNAPKTEIVRGAQVVDYGPYAYSVVAGYVIVGSTPMVKGVISAFSEPTQVRYGTDEIPALDVPEGVILLKDWELVPMIDKVMGHVLKAYPEAVALEIKMSPWSEILSSGEKDPVYLCFSLLPEERLMIRSLFDISKKPKYLEIIGDAQPMQVLKVLPDSTQASIFFQFTSEYRNYLDKNVIPQVKESLSDRREVAQGLQYGTSFMRMFGNEVGVCVTGNLGDFPAVIVLVRAAKGSESSLKGLLDVLVPSEGEPEKYREVDIKKVAVPSPIPVNIAMVNDLVVACNNVDVIKGIIDLVLDNGTSNYLKSLNPPVDPEVPKYTFISLQSKLFLDVIFPLMSILGKDLGSAQRDVEAVLKEVRELRILSEKKGGLLEGQVVAYFNPTKN